MTSNHSSLDGPAIGSVQPQGARNDPHRFGAPFAAVEHFVGLDLGQVHDPSAIAVLERSLSCTGQSPVTFDWIVESAACSVT